MAAAAAVVVAVDDAVEAEMEDGVACVLCTCLTTPVVFVATMLVERRDRSLEIIMVENIVLFFVVFKNRWLLVIIIAKPK